MRVWVHSSARTRVGSVCVCICRVLLSSDTIDAHESYARLPLARWPVGMIAILLEICVIHKYDKYMPLKTGLSVACAAIYAGRTSISELGFM